MVVVVVVLPPERLRLFSHRGEAMRDDEGGAALYECVDGLLQGQYPQIAQAIIEVSSLGQLPAQDRATPALTLGR